METEEDGYFLTQEELRDIFISLRKRFELSYEMLGKLCDIDPDILEAWENGQIALNKEAFTLLFSVYEKLSHPSKTSN